MKSQRAEKEEKILKYWQEKEIFKKTLEKKSPKGDFVFYEGPPTANGLPGIHHLEARAFKDAIPRYKTMLGYRVRRKGGWDTHGLPVELQVEKELGLKSKKDIEKYGIGEFNNKCRESVWKYVKEWENFTERIGYWVDLKNPYITYEAKYIESIWNIIKNADDRGLLYKDYKVVPWCPRCGTALSSHELAQGYDVVKDLSVYVKFKLKDRDNTFILAWTTTPWTLPGNVALAVSDEIQYCEIKIETGETLILAKERLSVMKDAKYEILKIVAGKQLVGVVYEPLYPFLAQNISSSEKSKLCNAYKVYSADFVTTADGTGVVHTAVMYGQDDFELGTKVGLPKYHLVSDDGTFKNEAGFLAGAFVKDETTDVAIIKDLASRGLLFAKEKYEHTYPFCWRCKTPLIYFARDSWYIRMSSLRNELVKANDKINWEPDHIKEGRFGEWLREIKDWAISRERYWGTPLPVWICDKCEKRKVPGSISEIARSPENDYFVMRHGEAENNVLGILSGIADAPHHLTDKGRRQVEKSATSFKKQKFDMVFVSPFVRTKETADIVKSIQNLADSQIVIDERLGELGTGEWNGRKVDDYHKQYVGQDRFTLSEGGIENFALIKKRMGDFLYDIESKYKGKKILIISHETPIFLLESAAKGLDRKQTLNARTDKDAIKNAECRKLDFKILPHNSEYESDLHKPFIDDVVLDCSCGGKYRRVKEVLDVWFDSGGMPFAQDHYPFEKKSVFGSFAYPADFISEAIDQTRGWFYTLHAIGVIMGKGRSYKNVVCLGHILDKDGKKMSKSLGNIVNPWDMMDKYGVDALRLWMYSINQPGESKNFEEKTVDEIVKKVFNLISNVISFYKLYDDGSVEAKDSSKNILDKWIIARLAELSMITAESMDKYKFFEPTRALRDFSADLSQWYVRRSRDRFKNNGGDKKQALSTLKYVMLELSKVLAPFTPFFAEEIYMEMGGKSESVHLEKWPKMKKADKKILDQMEVVRAVCSAGLDARMQSKINVRQPLHKLSVNNMAFKKLSEEMIEIIKDEVNIKSVVFDQNIKNSVELDTNITDELREEGELREFLRKVQDLRKSKGLTIKDVAVLVVTEDLRTMVTKNIDAIMKVTKISSVEYGPTLDLKF